MTGTAFVDKMYEAKLFINEEQLKKVRDEFISKFGREPNLNNKKDLQEFSIIVNEQVTDMKLRQTIFEDVPSSPRQIWNVLSEVFNRAKLSSLTFSEGVDIGKIIKFAVSIKQGDIVEYQVSGNDGLITVNKKDGTTKEISVSGRLVKSIIQNFYDENIAYVKGQSKDLLSNALAR